MIEIKHTPRQVIKEKWEFVIKPGWGIPTENDPSGMESIKRSECLVRDVTEADVEDWANRRGCVLVDSINDFLKENPHHMDIDRGDWGEGTEHFYITFMKKSIADAFEVLCDQLYQDRINGNVS